MIRVIFALAVILVPGSPARADEMMLRAGEWRIVREGPIPGTQVVCYAVDRPLGQMTHRGMDDCVQSRAVTGDRLITIDAICRMPDKLVTVHGTIRALGADTYRADSRIRFHRGGKAEGTDVMLRVTAKRLGPCQPGDGPG
jgi:hypothetical protein